MRSLESSLLVAALLATPIGARAQDPLSPGMLPPPVLACLQQRTTEWIDSGKNDTHALSDCGVGTGIEAARAVAFMGLRQNLGQYLDSPWTDAHCSATPSGFVCFDRGASVAFAPDKGGTFVATPGPSSGDN